MLKLGERLRELRERAGMSKAQLALAVGAHPNTIQAWEDDKYKIRGSNIGRLAKALNVPREELLDLGPEQPALSSMSARELVAEINKRLSLIPVEKLDHEAAKKLFTLSLLHNELVPILERCG